MCWDFCFTCNIASTYSFTQQKVNSTKKHITTFWKAIWLKMLSLANIFYNLLKEERINSRYIYTISTGLLCQVQLCKTQNHHHRPVITAVVQKKTDWRHDDISKTGIRTKSIEMIVSKSLNTAFWVHEQVSQTCGI